ncbi:hypothetical protein CANARDRAFT_215890 [[Candida] arabinofermentans NRRL YB-2248]|uniref:Magnesium transport protein CorA n=1 Tax=[Candida] arabinofermentans NRRL YB-2248 TaxID=983967 RepID=A0A1E4T855_9ASCO|nr:hypothetical protein CANARDRAFT_215890 [[Candida] arabinofermentans NRRL YB-2248]
MSKVFDSEDPNLPNLPENDQLSWSDYEGILSDMGSDTSVVDNSSIDSVHSVENSQVSIPTLDQQQQKEHEESTPFSGMESDNKPRTTRRRRRKGRRRRRQYAGSKAKKERAAWEPGIDIYTTNVVLKSPGSAITITDYSESRYRVEHYEIYAEYPGSSSQDDMVDIPRHIFMSDNEDENYDVDDYVPEANEKAAHEFINKAIDSKKRFEHGLHNRPTWSKVRWINVNGLSWEAISSIGEYFDLHRLSIEDMVDIPQRTKSDIYTNHLFVVLPLMKLMNVKKTKIDKRKFWFSTKEEENEENQKEREKQIHINSSLSEQIENTKDIKKLTDVTFVPMSKRNGRSRKLQYIESKRPLNSKGLGVGIEQVSMFLTDNNTVISFFEHSGNEIEKAILYRLSSDYTILRESCDTSILFESILDSIIDLTYPVITAYNRRLDDFEIDILINPTIEHTQELHLMINELSILKSKILPISNTVNQLKDKNNFGDFISENSNLYLSDISDHLLSFIDGIDSMSRTIENLVDLIFNTLSVETNNSMQQLSLITVIFLPLSFWAGYFGMNFKSFGNIEQNVSFYWKLTIPFTAGLLLLIMWKDVYKLLNHYRKLIIRYIADYKSKKIAKERKKARKLMRQRTMMSKTASIV